ncbi:HSP 40 [Gracilaria domingensis]|nr:HSP 40 [Gracilaria domingensis]
MLKQGTWHSFIRPKFPLQCMSNVEDIATTISFHCSPLSSAKSKCRRRGRRPPTSTPSIDSMSDAHWNKRFQRSSRRRSFSHSHDHPFLFVILFIVLLSFATRAYAGRDYYDILGVARDADSSTIKRAFRKLAVKYHPDKNPGDKSAAKRLVELNNAYEVLSDDSKRQKYDMFGEDGMNNQMADDNDDDDFGPFGSFFGGGFGGFGGRRRQREEPTVPDVVIPLTVPLETLYNGGILEVAHKKRIICSSWSDCEKKCSRCGGRGMIITTKRLGPGFVQQIQTHCPVCGGAGKIGNPKCKSCPNGQFKEDEKMLLVDVEKGMRDGQHIIFEHETDEIPDHLTGSVRFEIDTMEHDRFVRHGKDLHYRLSVTLSEALVGVNRQVRQLDGRLVPIQTDKVIKPGEKIFIAEEGMPDYHDGTAGNLIVEFWVDFPENLTEEQKKAVIELHGQPPSLDETGDGTKNSGTTTDQGKDEL